MMQVLFELGWCLCLASFIIHHPGSHAHLDPRPVLNGAPCLMTWHRDLDLDLDLEPDTDPQTYEDDHLALPCLVSFPGLCLALVLT